MAGGVRRAAGLVIFRQAEQGGLVEWLLLQTSYGHHHWTPPKGHLDPGEDEMTAALRETKEEAGLAANQLTVYPALRAELKYEAFNQPKIVTYWLARLNNPLDEVGLSEEHQALAWLPCKEATTRVGYPDLAAVITEFQARIDSGKV